MLKVLFTPLLCPVYDLHVSLRCPRRLTRLDLGLLQMVAALGAALLSLGQEVMSRRAFLRKTSSRKLLTRTIAFEWGVHHNRGTTLCGDTAKSVTLSLGVVWMALVIAFPLTVFTKTPKVG
jgi:hypothetical protein